MASWITLSYHCALDAQSLLSGIEITCIWTPSTNGIYRFIERKNTSKIALPAKGFWEPWNLGLDFKNDYSNIFFCVQVLLDVQAEFWDIAVSDAQFCIGWKQCMMQWLLLQLLKFFWLHGYLIQAGKLPGRPISCRCLVRMNRASAEVFIPFWNAMDSNFSPNCLLIRRWRDWSRFSFDVCIDDSFLLYF